MALVVDIAMVIAAGLGAAGWFAASTTLGGQYPDPVLLAWAVALASPLVLALAGLPSPARVRKAERSDVISASLGGVLVFAGAPLLVLVCRLTDAPSGSESLFFTTAVWSVLAVAASRAVFRDTSWTQAAGSLLALLGAAAVVANWERPSSFSPFVKFPLLEAGMVAAGVLFAAGSVLLYRASRSSGTRVTMSVAWTSALVVSLGAVVVTGNTGAFFTVPNFVLPQILLAVLSTAAFGVAWIFALDRVGVARASAGLFVPTLVLMGVAATEGVTHAYGANPIQWPAALAGAGTLVLGAIVLYAFAPARSESATCSVWDRTSIAIGGIGITLGVAVLFMPAFA
ncbi:MAG: hypothetical protein HY876_04880, partial [Coriobacteriales bacterium]|nr:hypothetical protein [Coriobacteriales bacterium]